MTATSPRRSASWFSPQVVVTALTLLGAALRLFHLGYKSLWMDEAASVALARMPWRQYAWVWWMQEGNMTAYYLLLRPWLHLGQSEAWIRLLSVIFGVAAIPAMFFLARRLSNTTAALLATALLAVNPAHIYYSQEARSYSLTIFLVLMSSLFFVKAMQEGRSRDWAWWALFSVVAVYAHYFAVLVLLAQAVSVLLLSRERVPWARLFGWSLVIFALALPGVSFVLLRGGKLHLPALINPTPKAVLHLWMFLAGSGVKFALYLVLWAAGVLAAIKIWRSSGRSEQSWRVGLLVIWAALPVAITVAASLDHSVFALKYLLICVPATVMFAAVGAETLRVKCLGIALVVTLCVLSLVTDIRSAYKPREDWRGVTRRILAEARPGDSVIFYPFYSRIAFDYYRERLDGNAPTLRVFAPPFYGSGEDEHNLRQGLASGGGGLGGVWVVLYQPSAQDEDLRRHYNDTSAALQARFGAPKLRAFKDILVTEYQH